MLFQMIYTISCVFLFVFYVLHRWMSKIFIVYLELHTNNLMLNYSNYSEGAQHCINQCQLPCCTSQFHTHSPPCVLSVCVKVVVQVISANNSCFMSYIYARSPHALEGIAFHLQATDVKYWQLLKPNYFTIIPQT